MSVRERNIYNTYDNKHNTKLFFVLSYFTQLSKLFCCRQWRLSCKL